MSRLLELDENGTLDRDLFHQQAEAEFGLSVESSGVLRDDFEHHFPESCVLFPNVFETLDALRRRGLKLGLTTNGRELIQGRKIDRVGLREYLDDIVISEAVGLRKPDPRIFSLALDNLDVDASSAVFVGDHPESDIGGARRCGMRTAWRRDTFWEEPPEADWVVDDLSELLPLVLGNESTSGGTRATG